MSKSIQNMSENQKKKHYIFRASRRNPKTGQIEYAKKYGKKAFKIIIDD